MIQVNKRIPVEYLKYQLLTRDKATLEKLKRSLEKLSKLISRIILTRAGVPESEIDYILRNICILNGNCKIYSIDAKKLDIGIDIKDIFNEVSSSFPLKINASTNNALVVVSSGYELDNCYSVEDLINISSSSEKEEFIRYFKEIVYLKYKLFEGMYSSSVFNQRLDPVFYHMDDLYSCPINLSWSDLEKIDEDLFEKAKDYCYGDVGYTEDICEDLSKIQEIMSR